MAMRKLVESDVKFEVFAELDTEPIEDSFDSGDADADRADLLATLDARAGGNIWGWAAVQVMGTFHGLTASDCLGGCSYADQAEFERDDYYADMRARVLADLQSQIDAIVSALEVST